MIIGVPKEIKEDENRVAVTPGGVTELVKARHRVLVQSGAGEGSRITDEEFRDSGAQIVASAKDIYSAELVVKVKEPVPQEYGLLRRGNQILKAKLRIPKWPKPKIFEMYRGGVATLVGEGGLEPPYSCEH